MTLVHDHPLHSWLWPVVHGADPFWNIWFPEPNCRYWLSQITIPEGAVLRLRGRFPYARYMSLQTYGHGQRSVDALNDAEMRPLEGHTNPALPGADRRAADRSYAIDVLPLDPPPQDERRPNTLYAGDGEEHHTLCLRVYLPDAGHDVTGGVGVPDVELHLADGRVLAGDDARDVLALGPGHRYRLTSASVSLQQFLELRDAPGRPAGNPALNPPNWQIYTGFHQAIADYTGRPLPADPAQGLNENRDIRYVYAHLSRLFGEVLVLRGALPRAPRTRDGAQAMASDVDMRYWSITQNESLYTQRGTGVLCDEDVPVDADGRYTIATSTTSDRPANATTDNGVAFLPWPLAGDGAGDFDYGLLILRNVIPDPGFPHATGHVEAIGDEAAVMGDYLPRAHYMSKAEFEKLGPNPTFDW